MITSILDFLKDRKRPQATAASARKLSIGIVGAGQIASDSHLPALLAMTDARVAWVSDRDAHRACLVAKTFRVPYAEYQNSFTDLPDCDVVLLAVPYGVRES